MKKILIALLLLVTFNSFVFAQGGKAEPLQIKFKKGSHSATVKDYLSRSQEAEYAFTANEGQKIEITITSLPPETLLLTMDDPEANEVKLDYDGKGKYSGTLPASGEYFLVVLHKDRTTKKSSYSLTLTIR